MNRLASWFHKLIDSIKKEENYLSSDFSLWSQRMIESLRHDIEMLNERIYKLECETRKLKK